MTDFRRGTATAGELCVEADPAEVGFDPERLRRVDRHLARHVDDGLLPGWLVTVSRRGRLAHVSTYGSRDIEAGRPVEPDTLWRLYSMTKPITSVAAMMLYEEGAFALTDPVSTFIPSFADTRVYVGGPAAQPVTVPPTEPVRLWHLLTHTAGLTYGWQGVHPVDALYRTAGFDPDWPPGMTLEGACDAWAGFPLQFQPGAAWNYSVSTDVLGRVVEVASGQRLDEFFATRIFGPLGMRDAGFYASENQRSRLAALYGLSPDGQVGRLDMLGDAALSPPTMLSGGGGLICTAYDYNRFIQMLLDLPDSPAGELEGTRLLSPRTVRYMGRNHLPGGVDLAMHSSAGFTEPSFSGTGFGLGFAVVLDPVARKIIGSPGELSWGGAANTAFWIDQAEELTVTLFTQLFPTLLPLRSQVWQLVYQALT
jgi:CubicO group peptidase (beta-lactamase class C family)